LFYALGETGSGVGSGPGVVGGVEAGVGVGEGWLSIPVFWLLELASPELEALFSAELLLSTAFVILAAWLGTALITAATILADALGTLDATAEAIAAA
jgi:hypothetical protein